MNIAYRLQELPCDCGSCQGIDFSRAENIESILYSLLPQAGAETEGRSDQKKVLSCAPLRCAQAFGGKEELRVVL